MIKLNWEEVYATYQPLIFTHIYLKLGHVEDARDIVADTFLKAIDAERRGVGCTDTATLESWLRRIARNTMVDHLRRVSVRSHLCLEVMDPPLCDCKPTPHEEAEASILIDSLNQAMTLLPPPQRCVMQMHADGYHLREIDDALGIASGTTKSRLHRARTGLKEYSILSSYQEET